jgi:predicted nucleic acid-binding protein
MSGILVDTSVWSLALRRRRDRLNPGEARIVEELIKLIDDGLVRIAGPIRQELLSGIREPVQFANLKDKLRFFPDEALTTDDFETAAAVGNRCRSKGVAGSAIDFLICAIALRRKWPVFSTDGDFERHAKIAGVMIHRC